VGKGWGWGPVGHGPMGQCECSGGPAVCGPGMTVGGSLEGLLGQGLAGQRVGRGPRVLSVHHDVPKPSTAYGFKVLKFQFSLVLYLSQVCLQHLSKVPDYQNSHSLCLCSSCHFGSSL
jgi:hypothetical protein